MTDEESAAELMEVTVLVPTDRVAEVYRAVADVIQPPAADVTKRKHGHRMSPEQRAAAAERMRGMQARLRAGRDAARRASA